MKLRLRLPAKKLRATATARRVAQPQDYEEEEPTMKLSSAFVVVLLLHLIAVGGILAFNSIKARRAGPYVEPIAEAKSVVAETSTKGNTTSEKMVSAKAVAESNKQTETDAKPRTSSVATQVSEKKSEPVKKTVTSGPRDSGQTHTVLKGEIPERIAKRFGVSYNDLIKLNHIEDATKLKIGQKLRIPVKRTPAATTTASTN